MPAHLTLTDGHGAASSPRARRRVGPAIAIGGAAILVERAALRRRGYRSFGNVVVRCRAGHLFTTIWVPGGSLKSLRLGFWRFQRCPVGRHWSIVTPVDESELTEDERHAAHEHRDIRVP